MFIAHEEGNVFFERRSTSPPVKGEGWVSRLHKGRASWGNVDRRAAGLDFDDVGPSWSKNCGAILTLLVELENGLFLCPHI